MAFIDDFSDMVSDTAQHAPLLSRDGYGAPTYDTAVSYSGRLVREHRMVRDAAGEQVVSTAQFWFIGTPAVDPQDKVTLSDGTTPKIISVGRPQDEGGEAFTKVYFL